VVQPHAGPIAASRTTSVIVNPLASIVIGVTAFRERLRPGPGFVTLDVLALTVPRWGQPMAARCEPQNSPPTAKRGSLRRETSWCAPVSTLRPSAASSPG
jgi:hypothetical protein